MVFVIKHVTIEGPGTVGEFFKGEAREVNVVELDKGDLLPRDLSGVEALIILGGPMNVYEEARYPFLKEEGMFLRRAIEKEIPVLGICLGAQLLAKNCGARVKRSEKEEIGWYRVSLTEDGKKDPFFESLDQELDVFQWHEDTFEIPEGATLLATSDSCKNQAFRFGKNAYGLQFHIEVTKDMIEDWTREYLHNADIESQVKTTDMIRDYYKAREKFKQQADNIYLNFSKIIAAQVSDTSDTVPEGRKVSDTC